MIPKKIHYCWFGGNLLPELAQKCIASWKKCCPDFEIIQWNEENFDISSCPLYVCQAYEAKKWSFVTDYVRLKVVYEHGGVYLDTDVELLQSLDGLLDHSAYFGFEDSAHVNTGLGFGAVPEAEILKDLMDDYLDIPYIRKDGTLDGTTCPNRNLGVFLRWGLIQNGKKQLLRNEVLILPTIYLCPLDYSTGVFRKSRRTVSVHHYAASWQSDEERGWLKEKQRRNLRWKRRELVVHLPNRIMMYLLGDEMYRKLKKVLKGD